MAFAINKNVHVKQHSDLKKYWVGSLRGAVFSDQLPEGFDLTHAKTT